MSLVSGHAKSAVATEGFYPQTIDQSLRFEDGDDPSLTRTPSVAGNQKTWTWSGWVKRGNITSTFQQLFLVDGSSDSTYLSIQFQSSTDRLRVTIWNSQFRVTNRQFRDPSAWYHIVVAFDTTQAVANDRVKVWVNGEQETSFATLTNPTLNGDYAINSTARHCIGRDVRQANYEFDGYLAEVHFTDGTAYTADDFGELKNDIWVPKANIASTLTYGTNGFYLPFAQDTAVEGFNTVTWRGNGSTSHAITGTGFQPDFVWIKNRSGAYDHHVYDSVRGAGERLQANTANAESTITTGLNSFDSNGFTLSSDGAVNLNTNSYVAWCWDAGDGSPASNTNGTITSTVKANPDYGFSIVSYTGNNTAGATVGHGLSSAPEVIIVKNRDAGDGWLVYHKGVASDAETDYLSLNTANEAFDSTVMWNDTAPGSSVFTLGNYGGLNNSVYDYIAYCFHSVSGYSDFGSYTGDGGTSNSVTTGFKPALVIIKCSSSGSTDWEIFDNTRSPALGIGGQLEANTATTEGAYYIQFDATGFTLNASRTNTNSSGKTYTYMAFADTRDAAFWLDESGNDNDWAPVNLENSDVVPDSPTNNFCVLNYVDYEDQGGDITEGGLQIDDINSGANSYSRGTLGVTSGKWYYEVLFMNASNGGHIGWAPSEFSFTSGNPFSAVGQTPSCIHTAHTTTSIRRTDDVAPYSNSLVPGTYSQGAGVVLGVGYDADAGEIKYWLDGTAMDSGNVIVSVGDPSLGWMPFVGVIGGGSTQDYAVNFGQDSTFQGQTTAGGNTDDSGLGDFKYTVPSGYNALCTSNLPDPTIDPAQDMYAGNNFSVHKYIGSGGYQLVGDLIKEVPDTHSISHSVVFEDGNQQYFSRSPASAGTEETFTYSCWWKPTNDAVRQFLFAASSDNTDIFSIYVESNPYLRILYYDGSSYQMQFRTNMEFANQHQWYHIVVAVDTTQATESDRFKLYVDGVLYTDFQSGYASYPAQNEVLPVNSTGLHTIGKDARTSETEWPDGYISEIHFVDGTAYDASYFGAFDADGAWGPINPSVTYGTNGFHLDLSDSAALGDDTSGNANDFTVNNFVASDQVIDTPTNNFATLDREISGTSVQYGNLKQVRGASWGSGISTIALPSGKWYWEASITSGTTGFVGVWESVNRGSEGSQYPGSASLTDYKSFGYYHNGNLYDGVTNAAYGSSFAAGDVVGAAFDMDNSQITFYVNGVSQGVYTFPESIKPDELWYAAIAPYNTTMIINFGQDSTFQGNETAASNQDENGKGEFAYSVPSGYLAICEDNLALINPTNNVESPDLVWIKSRISGYNHHLYDSIRGVHNYLESDTPDAEAELVNGLTGFHKNGFTVGDSAFVNLNNEDYVAWVWKGGTQASNSDGTIGTVTVSANANAGFSIVSYTGTGSATTVGHGLSQTPEMYIVKRRDLGTTSWVTYHKDLDATAPEDYGIYLDSAAIRVLQTNFFDLPPTDSVFSVNSSIWTNNSGSDYIGYVFHSVDGFSKCGYWIGNGSANGPFIYTGFRPKFLLTKNIDGATANWRIYDSERLGYNASQYLLTPDTAAAELASTEEVDFLSNGFKCRDTDTALNTNGVKYIYYAIAEQPMKYSNAR